MTFALISKPRSKALATTKPTAKRKSVSGRRAVDWQPGFENPAARLLTTALPSAPVVQAKLKIGEPNDKYEQEADRVADMVMRMPEPRASARVEVSGSASPTNIQRVCAECEEELQRQPMEEEEEGTIQAKEMAGRVPEVIPDVQARINGLQGSGHTRFPWRRL